MAGPTRRFLSAWYRIGKSVADEEKKEFKIDFRVQGIPQKAVYQDEDRTRRIKRLAHMPKPKSKEMVRIRDLQKTDTFKPFSAKSLRKSSTTWGNVEYFELCGVSAKTQCWSCVLRMWKLSATLRKDKVVDERKV